MTLSAGIFAAAELIKLGLELTTELASNPGMTAEQVAAKVAATKARARATIDGWRDARS
jgi:hypothetical protein